MWGALPGIDVAADGTEVTPSGLLPPSRDPLSIPLSHPQSSSMTLRQRCRAHAIACLTDTAVLAGCTFLRMRPENFTHVPYCMDRQH